MSNEFPDLIPPGEKARRRKVIRGWVDRLKSASDVPFSNRCMMYLKGYTPYPPDGYTDPEAPVREPSRIPEMLHALGQYWMAHPDLRLGQIIGNLNIGYFTEDDIALEKLEGAYNEPSK